MVAQHRCDVVFDVGWRFIFLSVSPFLHRKTEAPGSPLENPDEFANHTGLSNHNPCPVVDEEIATDDGSGWMSIPVTLCAYSVIILGSKDS